MVKRTMKFFDCLKQHKYKKRFHFGVKRSNNNQFLLRNVSKGSDENTSKRTFHPLFVSNIIYDFHGFLMYLHYQITDLDKELSRYDLRFKLFFGFPSAPNLLPSLLHKIVIVSFTIVILVIRWRSNWNIG